MKRRAIVRRLAAVVRFSRADLDALAAAAKNDSVADRDLVDLRAAFVDNPMGEAELELDLDQLERMAALDSPIAEDLRELVAEMIEENGPAPFVLLEERDDGTRLRQDVFPCTANIPKDVPLMSSFEDEGLELRRRYIVTRPGTEKRSADFEVTATEAEARRWLGWE